MTKKILSLVLTFMLLLSVSVFAAESKYYNMADTLIETVCGEDVLPVGEGDIAISRAEFIAT